MLIPVGILLTEILNLVCLQRTTEPKGLSLVKEQLRQDSIIYFSFKKMAEMKEIGEI